MRHLISISFLLSVFFFASYTVSADLPTAGMTMTVVQTQYGDPLEQTTVVGKPPIHRWNYSNFTVVFEDKYVVHAFPRIAKIEAKAAEY